jgi:choline dehydrogenase
MATKDSFDYIVIGAGATGCVVANRLSANRQTSVLLLEAGLPDTDPNIHTIGGFVGLWGSDVDWKFATEPQAGQNGRTMLINQGKVIGGSASINALMYVRGNRRNFDRWSDLGNDGWSYDEVLPYFKRSEHYEGGGSEFHGAGGPLSVRNNPDPASRSEAFMVGATELGYDGPYWDYNGARQEDGGGLLQFTIDKDGRRSSAATAFLAPALDRQNLTVQTGAEVTRLVFEGTRVVGVQYLQDGQLHQVDVVREVIVSAGAFQSPKLLMLSGIGPADHLRSHGIPVIADLPGVGQNLQDHLQLPVVYRSNVDLPMPTLLTGNVLFVRTQADAEAPDLQLNFTPSVPAPLAPILALGMPACIFLPILVQPRSVGEVRLRSAHPQDPALINPNYLQQDADMRVFVQAVELIRELMRTRAFADLNGGELVPGRDAELEGFIRTQTSTLWHPVGTCKMGRDDSAVVDPWLRVYGVQGVRVADASVMPTIVSGNTLAACYMIGEKVADRLLQDK